VAVQEIPVVDEPMDHLGDGLWCMPETFNEACLYDLDPFFFEREDRLEVLLDWRMEPIGRHALDRTYHGGVAPYLLLDGHSLAFRAWFALQEANLVTSSGQETQAVYGFAGMLGRLLEDHSPAGMAVCFDRPEATFRDALADDYKAGRPATPASLHEQIDLIRQMVELMGAPVVELTGFEADDLIATLATQLEAAGEDVIIVTGDRDAYQLVRDPHVKVLYNRRGVTDYVLYDEAGILARTGVQPVLYPIYAALRGDPSDNLPGVPGVGEKTAAKLVNAYGDLDSIFGHLDDLTPKLREALRSHELRARLNARLTPLVRDAPLECELSDLRFGGSQREELVSLFNLLEIRAPRDRILAVLDRLEHSSEVSGPAAADDTPEELEVRINSASEPMALEECLDRLLSRDSGIVVEPKWTGQPGRSRLAGLALCPVLEANESSCEVIWLPAEQLFALRERLQQVLGETASGLRRLVAFRSKELMRALMPSGFSFSGLDLDLAVAAYLIDPNKPPAEPGAFDGAARIASPAPKSGEQLGFDLSDEQESGLHGRGLEAVVSRAASLSSVVARTRRALVDTGAERLYAEIERPLVQVLAKMEVAGIEVDRERLQAISDELSSEALRLEAEVQRLAGESFTVNSTKQLRHVLFEVLHLAPQKKTKTGYSTDAQSLERLRGEHPIIETLLAYREVEKLRSTYGQGLLQEIADDGRIHASFNQTVARTGRLSSDQPNLHNIPVRSVLGRQFRQAFVPAPNMTLLVADYDQIELRVIAHLAEDPGLIEAFRTGLDIHSTTAQRLYGVDATGVTPLMRSRAKMVSYGLAYGMEAYGLSQRLTISVEEASAILNQYFVAFPNVKAYMTRTVADARARGYTETLFGRRRYLPDLGSANYQVRQAAERQAMNAGIQGLAADIFKVALVQLDRALAAGNYASRVVLQVHDEVLVESPCDEADEVMKLTEEVMRTAASLSVPLAVHVAQGSSWADAKDPGGADSLERADDEEIADVASELPGLV
jgi:DNA polymerase-1